jgi:hypothetical protein
MPPNRHTSDHHSLNSSPDDFVLRKGKANHPLMERQVKWSKTCEIKMRKSIDEDRRQDFTVVAEKVVCDGCVKGKKKRRLAQENPCV